MIEQKSLDIFLNQRDQPDFRKYHMKETGLYNLRQFLVDSGLGYYDHREMTYRISSIRFNSTWNMSYLYAEDCDFRACDFSGCHLVYGNYDDVMFSAGTANDPFLMGTSFYSSSCHSASFTSDSLDDPLITMIDLSQSDLRGAYFFRINFVNSSFMHAKINNAQFKTCVLQDKVYFNFSQIESTHFVDCNITFASFQQATLNEVTFENGCIRGLSNNNIDFSYSTIDHMNIIQNSTDICPEISNIDLRHALIMNSQLINLRLYNVNIDDQFRLINSNVYDNYIRWSDDQCMSSCQLGQYFEDKHMDASNTRFAPPDSMCWVDKGDKSGPCGPVSALPLLAVGIGLGAGALLLFLAIGLHKLHRQVISPYLLNKERERQIKWKTWPLTQALSASDEDAIKQIAELSAESKVRLPRDMYKYILTFRKGHSDAEYRHFQDEFGDPSPHYQKPEVGALGMGIRFFDTNDRKKYRQQKIENTITSVVSRPCQSQKNHLIDEEMPLIGQSGLSNNYG
jgi:uncharacterized protein YjbI with pentapeptide repeats